MEDHVKGGHFAQLAGELPRFPLASKAGAGVIECDVPVAGGTAALCRPVSIMNWTAWARCLLWT